MSIRPTLMGHPLGLVLLLNSLSKSPLVSPLTPSSKVSRTNWGVFSLGRSPVNAENII